MSMKHSAPPTCRDNLVDTSYVTKFNYVVCTYVLLSYLTFNNLFKLHSNETKSLNRQA